jgi:uncharacterized DUF497 family protein
MEIEYDPAKARANFSKHGVSFDEAVSSLFDANALVREDTDSEGEPRWVLLGMSSHTRLLVVVYRLRDEERIRLISARRATRTEVRNYER